MRASELKYFNFFVLLHSTPDIQEKDSGSLLGEFNICICYYGRCETIFERKDGTHYLNVLLPAERRKTEESG